MTADIDALLRQVHAGDAGARDRLFTAAYDELRKLAHARLRDGGRDALIETTVLVHESYLRFLQGTVLRSGDRRAFFAYASQVMRSVIIDSVRQRQADRRGGGMRDTSLDTHLGGEAPRSDVQVLNVLNVHEALLALEQSEPRLAKVVEMRYFGGYTEQEIADTLGVAERTVRRDWEKARLLLTVLLER
jgi:RNA polymerase sigma factor (TIGR02999 family)